MVLLNGSKLGQGRDAVKGVIEDNPERAEDLTQKISADMYEEKEDKKERKKNP